MKKKKVKKKGVEFAIVSLVTGTLSILLLFVPVLGQLLAITAIVTGIIGRRNNQGGMATTGMILGIISLALAIIAVLSFIAFFTITAPVITYVESVPVN